MHDLHFILIQNEAMKALWTAKHYWNEILIVIKNIENLKATL